MTDKPTNSANEFNSAAVRPVTLFQTQENGKLKCKICEFGCELAPGETGVCKMRHNIDGTLLATNFGVISRADLEQIEKKNFYNFFPGSKIFSIGGYGQNFPHMGGSDPFSELPTENPRLLPVDRFIKFSIEHRCRGVVVAYNEPSMWYEYLSDALRSIKANGMYTGMVTNGYFTTEALDNIGHYVDGILLEVNAFSDATFKVLTGQSNFQKVLENATRAQRKHKIHLEISTKLIPGVNDNLNELRTVSAWIKQVLGENTAWHLSCAVEGEDELLKSVKAMAEEVGLHYIYLHGIPLEPVVIPVGNELIQNPDNTAGGHTFCHNCHRLLVARNGHETHSVGLEKDHCSSCRAETGIHSTIWKL